MDLNYLYQRRGESLLRASRAIDRSARLAYEKLADQYALRIARIRDAGVG